MSERVEPSDVVEGAEQSKTISGTETAHAEREFSDSPEIGPTEPTESANADLHTGLTEKLRRTHPNPPVEEVGSLDDIREHYQGYLLRGIEKIAGAEDSEAWVDLVKGVLGVALEANANAGDSGETVDIANQQ